MKKEENDAGVWGRSRPPVGSRGKAPGRGVGATPPEAEGFFSMSSQKKPILEHENQTFASQRALCLDQTFTWLFSKLH